MEIKRDKYVEKLFAHRWNGMVKVITGVNNDVRAILEMTGFCDTLDIE